MISSRHPLFLQATSNPHGIAASDGQRKITWRELFDETTSACAMLADKNVRQGSLAIAGLFPSLAALPWIHALPASGVVPLYVNPFATATELGELAGQFWFSVLLGGTEAWDKLFPTALRLPTAPVNRPNVQPGASLPSGGEMLLLTSGTSGTPKAARLSLLAFQRHAEASRRHLSLTADDCWLMAMPLHHVGGMSMLLRAAHLGCRVEIRDKFNADDVSRLIDAGSISHLSVVPTTLRRLLDARAGKPFPPALKCILTGGAALSTEIADSARRLNAPVAPTYGMTEACSQAATLLPHEFLAGQSTGAPLLPGVEVSIRNTAGFSLEGDGEGEIWLRAPFLFEGYLGEGSFLDAEGWYATGDIGYLKKGRLRVLDRRTDLIVSGGENVYPSEIERCLRQLDGIRDCAVIGVPDPAWGARVTAVIEGSSPDPESILSYCRAQLSSFKVPKAVVFIDHLPRTTTGKIQHQALRNLFACELSGDSLPR